MIHKFWFGEKVSAKSNRIFILSNISISHIHAARIYMNVCTAMCYEIQTQIYVCSIVFFLACSLLVSPRSCGDWNLYSLYSYTWCSIMHGGRSKRDSISKFSTFRQTAKNHAKSFSTIKQIYLYGSRVGRRKEECTRKKLCRIKGRIT